MENFPELGGRRQISIDGGWDPRWSADGSELFYRRVDDGAMMVVSVTVDPTFEPGTPEVLFEGPYVSAPGGYDVAADGRFLMITLPGDPTGGGAGPKLNIVLNWFEELKRRVPTGR